MVELSVARWAAPDVVVGRVEALLERYRRYLKVERGLADASAGVYVRLVRPFLAEWASTGGLDLEHLTAGDVSAFVVGACRDGRNGSAKPMVTALRSLLVFLHVEGLICEGLTGAVPSVAHWPAGGVAAGA
jgi:integrase/recombinase XerD